MSSRVNLSLLIDHIHIHEMGESNLNFKVLHSCSLLAAPPMNLHIHESLFSFDFTRDELLSFHKNHAGLLSARVKFEFTKTISTYAALLCCKRRELPESILYEILPFLGGETLPKAVLEEIVYSVGEEMKKQEGPLPEFNLSLS